MCASSNIVKQRQLAIRREMDRRGMLLKIVAADAGIPYPTLASYFPADANADPAQIPGGAIYALTAALPADMLSMLLPDGWQIVRAPEAVDHDAIGAWAETYAARKLAAHRADSECAEKIGPNERAALDAAVVEFPAVAK